MEQLLDAARFHHLGNKNQQDNLYKLRIKY